MVKEELLLILLLDPLCCTAAQLCALQICWKVHETDAMYAALQTQDRKTELLTAASVLCVRVADDAPVARCGMQDMERGSMCARTRTGRDCAAVKRPARVASCRETSVV